VRCTRICDRGKTDALIKLCGSWVFSAKTNVAKVLPGACDESPHQRFADTSISPCLPHVNAADSAHVGATGKWIAIKPAHRYQQSLIETATEYLSWRIESIFTTRPILDQSIEEKVALIESFLLQCLYPGYGQLDLLNIGRSWVEDRFSPAGKFGSSILPHRGTPRCESISRARRHNH